MRLTHEQAVRKLCPQGVHLDPSPLCCGASCMAWRWNKTPTNKVHRAYGREGWARLVEEPARPASVPADWVWMPYDANDDGGSCWIEPDESARERRTGYCGLAGTPEYG